MWQAGLRLCLSVSDFTVSLYWTLLVCFHVVVKTHKLKDLLLVCLFFCLFFQTTFWPKVFKLLIIFWKCTYICIILNDLTICFALGFWKNISLSSDRDLHILKWLDFSQTEAKLQELMPNAICGCFSLSFLSVEFDLLNYKGKKSGRVWQWPHGCFSFEAVCLPLYFLL